MVGGGVVLLLGFFVRAFVDDKTLQDIAVIIVAGLALIGVFVLLGWRMKLEREQPVQQKGKLTDEEIAALQEFVVRERGNAVAWEYAYLNYYLAGNTQIVLDWLSSLFAPIGLENYHDALSGHNLDEVERRAILNALLMHALVVVQDDSVQITDKGRQYVQWPHRRRLAGLGAII